MIRYLYLPFLCLFTFAATAQQRTPLEQHIHDSWKIIQERRVTDVVNGNDIYDKLKDPDGGFKLPLGIGGSNNGKPPVIVDSIRFLPDHAEITVFMVVVLPGTDRELMFAARGVPLSSKGGLVGIVRMELVNDQPIYPFGDSTELVFKAGKTFVEFDCNGFVRLGLGADVSLTRKLVKENADGTLNEIDRVKGHFEVVSSDLNDIITTVSIDPFQVRGVQGVSFTVQDAVVDLSDYKNATGMIFPPEYDPLYTAADRPLWRGFYLRNLTVALPPELKDRREKGKRKTFTVRNALIDENGFSGEVLARNLIPIESGDMGGWAFSVDEIKLGFALNQLTSGGLSGGLNVPITGDTTQFVYSAIFHPGKEYIFTIQPKENVSFDIFKAAYVTLAKSSFLEVSLKGDNTFKVMASLTGKLSIGGEVKADSTAKKSAALILPDLAFEQLVISNQAPFIHSGTFALVGGNGLPKLGGYALSVDNVKMVKDGDDRGLGLDVHLNLMGGSGGFAADATLAVLGNVKDDDGRFRFRFSRILVSKIAIDVDQGPFALKGTLLFFNGHDIYGDGFRGDIDARLKLGKDAGGFRMAATALFGNVSGDRYWYADIMLEFPGPLPLFPPLMATGFGGGLYYGVKQLATNESTKGYEIGTTPTGVTYKPSPDAGLGIKASVNIALANDKLMNGIVGLEMAFNKSGGLSRVSLTGLCNVVSPPLPGALEKLKNKYKDLLANVSGDVITELNKTKDASGQLSVNLRVDADFENNTLYANLKAYVNVAGGILKGTGSDGLAGEGVFYVGPDGWYLHIGSPDNPIGVQFAGLARSRAYFMVGKDLPGSPAPPPNVSQILGGKDMDYMRDLNALGKGNGIAFGAGMDFDTGDLTFLVFYARLAAGLGFDVMLKDYGEDVRCEGRSGPLGVNGWYANGQLYAYFQGKIGIKVNLFFKKGRFDILSLGAAVVLQAKLPNPTWMKGTVGGYFSILGGLVSGRCNFEVTIGEKCKLVDRNLFAEAGVQVIADATPGSGEQEVDIFNTPQVVFNMPVGKTFTITDDEKNVHTFRARLEYFNLREKEQNVPGTMEWNEDNTVVVIRTPDVLTPQSAFRMTARVAFEELVKGSWSAYLIAGQPYAETVDHAFNTGDGPTVIPDKVISYSYPIRKQLNYYKNETRQGYIWLSQGMPYMFNPGSEYRQVARVIPADGAPVDFDFVYTSGKIGFNLPAGIMNNKTYTLQLVNVPVAADNSVDRNVQTNQTTGEGDVAISTKSAIGNLNEVTETIFYETSFRASSYNTFSDKIDAMGIGISYRIPLRNGVHELGYQINNQELFDENEIDVYGNSKVLQFEAILDDNTWYQQDVYPLLYQGYPTAGMYIDWRNVSLLGVPPAKAIGIRQLTAGLLLEQTNMSAQTGLSTFVYNLPHFIERDYINVVNNIANAFVNRKLPVLTPQQEQMLSVMFVPVRKGNYRFKVKYILPGTDLQTSVKEITIINSLGL
jgi:hypothetical protein